MEIKHIVSHEFCDHIVSEGEITGLKFFHIYDKQNYFSHDMTPLNVISNHDSGINLT